MHPVRHQRDPNGHRFLVDREARWALTRVFGVSAYTFADFNSAQSFGGVAVGMFLGVF